MAMASADSQSFTRGYYPLGLEIILLKRSYVFAWSQFLYAEGGNDEVRLAFSTHDILIKGSGLHPLLADLATHGIARLQEQARADRFLNEAVPSIREISVKKIEQNWA